MQGELKKALAAAANKLFGENAEPEITRPEEKFGDYSTNLALQIAQKSGKDPHQTAQALAQKLEGLSRVKKIDIAGPGFINFTLTDEVLWKATQGSAQLSRPLEGQEILVEFGDPNPFKEMHIGHLYSYIVGDSIAKLLESAGAKVRRLSYHGDVGLHVAKAIWGMKTQPEGQELGSYYAVGSRAYEEDPKAAEEIIFINERVYKKDDEQINQLYEQGKTASFDYFDQTLSQLGVRTDKRYLESETITAALEFIHSNTPAIFKESDGAIIYEGEKAGLHTRVFINSRGLPTYEAKDLGLAELKHRDYPAVARSIIITANEQSEYFKVMLAALREFDKDLADKTTHLPHGFLSLTSGKMSSRTGDIYSARSLLRDVETTAKNLYPDTGTKTYLAAVKYGFLKHRLGSDIVYDVKESVSLEGNSGPYLQYAHARAHGILLKSDKTSAPLRDTSLEASERSLARKISEYPEVVERAVAELMPHHIANYLYELAQTFNRFYESSRIIGDERQALRLHLAKAYADILKSGLGILNISAPERI
ncbi:MAG: arginine--tRNA ligase [Candidatus Saccharimonadales bacterium]